MERTIRNWFFIKQEYYVQFFVMDMYITVIIYENRPFPGRPYAKNHAYTTPSDPCFSPIGMYHFILCLGFNICLTSTLVSAPRGNPSILDLVRAGCASDAADLLRDTVLE